MREEPIVKESAWQDARCPSDVGVVAPRVAPCPSRSLSWLLGGKRRRVEWRLTERRDKSRGSLPFVCVAGHPLAKSDRDTLRGGDGLV